MSKVKTEKKEFVVTGANPACTRCALCKGSKVVCTWGNGNTKAEIMLIGDTPFSIEADQLLTKYLQLSGIDRQAIFVDVVCRCKTPMNRVLKPAEIKACAPYLDYEINQVKPKVIGLLGAVALERVLGVEGITKFRGKPVWSEKYNCWCVPTWHPSYILRNKESLEETEQFRRDLEFIKKIAETGDTGQLKTTYDVIDSIELFNAMMTCLKSYKVASLDTETYGDYLTGKIITIQFTIKVGTTFVVPFYKNGLNPIWTKEQEEHIWTELKNYLENPEYKKVGQNIKYDYQFLKLYGIILKGVIFDTLLGDYLLNENIKGQHDLGTMALKYTDMGDYSLEFYNNLKCEPEEIKYKVIEAPFESLCRYACKDADATFRIFCVLYPKIKQQGLETLLQKVMIPLSFVLGEMELTGVLVDTEYYKKLAEEYESKIKELEDEFNSYPDIKLLERKQGKPVNFNSPTQMKALFYDLLKLPILKYTKNKNKKNKNAPPNPSTDEETLEKLAEYHPIPTVLMKHRKFSKFLNTYVSPIPKLLYSDGRLHTNYFQQITVTGRLASSKPNLQNIPKKEPEMAMQIRRGLIATEGYTFIESDLGQIEFRLLANECRDETMLKDISSGLDIHKTIASIAFKVPYDKVTPEIREKAKTIVYCVPLDTQILTQSGWKLYSQVQIGDYTIGYNPETKQNEWTKITKIHYYPKASIMEIKNSTFNFRCTPEHRWLNRRRTSGECIIPNKKYKMILKEEFVFTKDINQEDNLILSVPFHSIGSLDLSNDEVALIAWMLTDGGKHAVYQSTKKFAIEIKELFERLFKDFTVYKRDTDNCYLVPAKQARFIFGKAGLNFDLNKKDTGLEQFVLKLSSEQRAIFLNTAMRAEAHKNIFYQNPGPVLEAVKLAAYLEGFLVRQRDNYKWNKWSTKHCQALVLSKPKVTGQELTKQITVEEPVWCVTTELGTMTVKQENFIVLTGNSIVYGKGEENLAKETGLTVKQVQAIFGAIYRRYPRVKPYMLSLINRAKTTGEVTNWIGRRRRLADGFKSGVKILMAEAERQAVNSPIQGGAHDILSVATIKIYSKLKRRNLKSRLVLTIHDALVLEVKNEELNEVIKLVKTIMETSPSKKIIVPLVVDISVGTKLGEMKKLTKEDLEKILNG